MARQDEQLMAFAGLWEGFRWTDGTVTRSFCIITTDANRELAELHAEGRAPVSHVTIGKIIAGRAMSGRVAGSRFPTRWPHRRPARTSVARSICGGSASRHQEAQRKPCCAEADGHNLSDSEWRQSGSGYQVRVGGFWFDVPSEAVITGAGRCGPEPDAEHRSEVKVWYVRVFAWGNPASRS
jgi:hypothetical protein